MRTALYNCESSTCKTFSLPFKEGFVEPLNFPYDKLTTLSEETNDWKGNQSKLIHPDLLCGTSRTQNLEI